MNSFFSGEWGDNGKFQICIPLSNVDMLVSTSQLLVKTGWAFDKGDIIEISNIMSTIKEIEAAWEFPNHSFLLTIECDKIDQLRELLAYKMEKCVYTIIVNDKGQMCGENALYRVSRPSKSGKIIAKALVCKKHMLQWRNELSDIKVEEL